MAQKADVILSRILENLGFPYLGQCVGCSSSMSWLWDHTFYSSPPVAEKLEVQRPRVASILMIYYCCAFSNLVCSFFKSNLLFLKNQIYIKQENITDAVKKQQVLL